MQRSEDLQLVGPCVHSVDRVLFLGDGVRLTQAELEHYADAGVRVFLAAYAGS